MGTSFVKKKKRVILKAYLLLIKFCWNLGEVGGMTGGSVLGFYNSASSFCFEGFVLFCLLFEIFPIQKHWKPSCHIFKWNKMGKNLI